MTNEVEPWVQRTVSLLLCRTDEATDQLRNLLEDTLRQKYGIRKPLRPLMGHKKQVEDQKKSKIEHKKASPTTDVNEQSQSDSESSSNDSDDLAMEILEDDLACVVCREMAIGPRNRLVECADCHALYHQECHTPNISDMDVSDPRLVWYCSNCNKTVARPKMPSSSGSSGSSKSNYNKPSSTPRTSQASPVMPFVNKPFGGLIATSKKSTSNSANKTIVNPAKSISSNINIISADRRLQIMKKRAAKKQEKRILPK